MKKNQRKKALRSRLSLLLVLALLVLYAVPASAAGMGGPGGPGGPGVPGGGSAGQEFATFEEVASHAALGMELLRTGITDTSSYQVPAGSDFDGTLTLQGEADASGVSGLMLEGSGSGLAIALDSEDDVFTIGGTDTPYELDGKAYNSVLKVSAGSVNDDAGYEAVSGVAAAISTGTLRIENSYLYSDGPRSTPLYAFSTSSPGATSVVAVNSTLEAHSSSIWMPPFKLLAGGARATLLMTRNHSWFYGCDIRSNNWGAISQDSVDATTYVVNSTGTSTEGGYGTYLTYGMRLYGSELYGGQYGVFMCGTSDILTDTGAAALEDINAMSQEPDFAVDSERISTVAAPFNAIVVHNSLPQVDMVAAGTFRNSVISTLPEDLPAEVTPMVADDAFLMPGVDILGSGNGCGASYFFSRNLYGALALVRSMNADFSFDNTETRSSSGVLLQSVVTYDPPSASGYLTPEQGDQIPGISGTFLNGTYEGDILHQDYQRGMTVYVGENASLKGCVVSGTYAAWNDLWSEEALTETLSTDGYSPDFFENDQWVQDVQTNLIRAEDTVYADTENHGIAMTVVAGGSWVVTGDSSLSALTLEEGAELTVPEGCQLAVYTDCDASNSLLFYDEAAGNELPELTAGTYENVVLRVTGTPVEPVEATAAAESSAAETSEDSPLPDTADAAVDSTQDSSAEIPSAIPADGSNDATEDIPVASNDSGSKLPAVLAVIAVIAAGAGATFLVFRRRKK